MCDDGDDLLEVWDVFHHEISPVISQDLCKVHRSHQVLTLSLLG